MIVVVTVVVVVVVAVSRVVVDVLQIAIFKFLLCFILDCHGQYKYYKYIYLAMYIYICRERETYEFLLLWPIKGVPRNAGRRPDKQTNQTWP